MFLVLPWFFCFCREVSASSPVARDHWEIFELIIKESGDKGSDGKGRKSITPRSRSTLVPIIPLSRFSRAREFPYPHLALGKPVEEAGEVFGFAVAVVGHHKNMYRAHDIF